MNSNLQLLVFLFILGIHGCKYSTEEIKLETQPAVIESISETFDISASNIEVEEYSLIAKSENCTPFSMRPQFQNSILN